MRVGVGLGSQLGLEAAELTELAGLAGQLGYDSAWTPQRSDPDAFVTCEQWARVTSSASSTLRVGIGVLPAPAVGDPAGVALAAAATARQTGGRFVLGIGTGGYGPAFWSGLGLPDRPIAVMRDYLEFLRSALAGEGTVFRGRTFDVEPVHLPSGPEPVPLYLAALGPQMIRLGGECADGVVMNWADPDGVRSSRELLDEGAVRAGRPLGSISLAMYVRCAVNEDVEAARRAIASEILVKVLPRGQRGERSMLGYRAQFARLGFEDAITELETRNEAGVTGDDLLDAVPVEMCRAAGYFGDGSDARSRIAELAVGLDEVILRIIPGRARLEDAAAVLDALRPVDPTNDSANGSRAG